jgi:glycosyltransferase involved in cell wall biosynthesis
VTASAKQVDAGPSARDRTSDEGGLRILFVSKNHLPHVGGAEISTHHLARALVSSGHAVAILSSIRPRSAVGVGDLFRRRVTGRIPTRRTRDLGYDAFYSRDTAGAVSSVVETFRADIVVAVATDPALAIDVLMQVPTQPAVLYVRGASAVPFVLAGAHFDAVVANSPFIRRSIGSLGVPADFLPSVFPPDVYTVPTSRSKVLFVNPIKKKGVSIAMSLAAEHSDIPFVFSLSWRMRRAEYRSVMRAASSLGNVEVRQATSDPSVLYRDARLVLVPTQWPEAWSRVVSEAQMSGIPAIGAQVGGLPDAVGLGGLLVEPPYSTQAWSDALSAVWHDRILYEELSARAREHIRRPEMKVDSIVRRFEVLVRDAEIRHETCA